MNRKRLIAGGKVGDGINLSDTGKNLCPYPYMLVLEQSKNEQLLYNYLQNHQKEVLWNTTLESFSHDDNGVRAVVKNGENQSQTIEESIPLMPNRDHLVVKLLLSISGFKESYSIFHLYEVHLNPSRSAIHLSPCCPCCPCCPCLCCIRGIGSGAYPNGLTIIGSDNCSLFTVCPFGTGFALRCSLIRLLLVGSGCEFYRWWGRVVWGLG